MAFIDEIERYKELINQTKALKEKIKNVAVNKGLEVVERVDTMDSVLDKLDGLVVGDAKLEKLTVTPSTTEQTIKPNEGFNGFLDVTVNPVTSSIDANITPENIKKDVTVLGVTGTLEEGITPTGTLDISENGERDVTTYEKVNVNVQPLLQEKTVTENGTIVADEGYDGLSSVEINVKPNLQIKTTTKNGTITADEGYDGLSKVFVNIPETGNKDFSSYKIQQIVDGEYCELIITDSNGIGTDNYMIGTNLIFDAQDLYIIDK